MRHYLDHFDSFVEKEIEMTSARSLSLSFVIGLVLGNACHAETINVTRTGLLGTFTSFVHGRFRDYFTGYSQGSLVASLDTVTDLGTLTSVNFGTGPTAFSSTSVETVTVPPMNFPDPPMAKTFRETVSYNAISFPIQHRSTTHSPIVYSGGRYRFFPDMEVSYPDRFNLSGTYRVQGPTESITVPFSVEYVRATASGIVDGKWDVSLLMGTNFPATARFGAAHTMPGVIYEPTGSTTIFDGVVDGLPFLARAVEPFAQVYLPQLPEPTSAVLVATSIIGFLGRQRRRVAQQPKRPICPNW